ncbi:hypothetical protein WH50_04000 [Pokkaliibacter plantistimulans]|uniref:Der GTPase-activating protein YihI n=1 Tax=Pokkaliibacter plantistimulans TaxID=1635171 RepID=A0ABX5M4F7_9GAMM|nr:hypothetical protein [Pokkaliibacter plantistimulans]PXF32568.1 hypothetical protein WH50_04000 [Pokkaliibacter plantistimulans]
MSRSKKSRATAVEREKEQRKNPHEKPQRRDANPDLKKLFKQRWLDKNKRVKSVYQKAVDADEAAEAAGKGQHQRATPRRQQVLDNLARLQRGLPVSAQEMDKQINKRVQKVVTKAEPEWKVEPPFPGAEKDQRLMSILKRMNEGRNISEEDMNYFDDVIMAHEQEVNWVDEEGSDDLWDAFERSGKGPR